MNEGKKEAEKESALTKLEGAVNRLGEMVGRINITSAQILNKDLDVCLEKAVAERDEKAPLGRIGLLTSQIYRIQNTATKIEETLVDIRAQIGKKEVK